LFIHDRRSKRVLTDDALTGLNARDDTLRGDINRVAARHDVALRASGRGSLMTVYTATHDPSAGQNWRSTRPLCGFHEALRNGWRCFIR
jgi:glutamate-1-semialdehyde aminotransferase